MVSQNNEQALEATIEKALSGISREALNDQVGNGYQLLIGLQEDADIRKFQISAADGAKHKHKIKHPFGKPRSTPVWHS